MSHRLQPDSSMARVARMQGPMYFSIQRVTGEATPRRSAPVPPCIFAERLLPQQIQPLLLFKGAGLQGTSLGCCLNPVPSCRRRISPRLRVARFSAEEASAPREEASLQLMVDPTEFSKTLQTAPHSPISSGPS